MNLRDTIGYPEVILAVFVIVTLLGMWMLFGYGLSDATSAEKQPACQHRTKPSCPAPLKKGELGECPKPINPCPLLAE